MWHKKLFTFPLNQLYSTGADFAPKGQVAESEDILACDNWKSMIIESSGWGPRMLLDILQYTA